MYCVRVNPGSERIRARQFMNGFLPSYTHVDEKGKPRGKRLVVPGFVFMLESAPGAIVVPDDEWKVIDAISDSNPSVLDYASRRIVEGPLKVVESEIMVVEADRIKVMARILGENRVYWLGVKSYEPEVAAVPEEDTPDRVDAETRNGGDSEIAAVENVDNGNSEVTEIGNGMDSVEPVKEAEDADKDEDTKTKKNREMSEKANQKVEYTPEQEAEMIARSEEVGIQQAAKEYSVPWQVIAGMKRRANAKDGGKKAPKARKDEPGKKTGKAKKAETTAEAEKAKNAAAVPEKEIPEPAGNVGAVSETEPLAEIEPLKVENVVLRERISKLEAQALKLKKALMQLL